MFSKFKNYLVSALLGAVAIAAPAANATAPDFTALSSAVDFTTLTTAIMTIFSAMIVAGLVLKGGRTILRLVGFH